MNERNQIEEKDTIVALDFVINSLMEHEKSLSHLSDELERIAEHFSEVGDLTAKIYSVEDSLSTVEDEIPKLGRLLKSHQKTSLCSCRSQIIAEFKQWGDFKVLAATSEIVSFLFEDTGNTVQINALKGILTLTYSGDLQKGFSQDKRSLKTWLSSELDTPEEKIFEGSLVAKN